MLSPSCREYLGNLVAPRSEDRLVQAWFGHVAGVRLATFSRASFAIQPRSRLRTLLDGADPQAPGVAGM